MRFSELEPVIAVRDFPEEGIKSGSIGTVVVVFCSPVEAYEVEFVNDDGTTKAMFAIRPEDLKQCCE